MNVKNVKLFYDTKKVNKIFYFTFYVKMLNVKGKIKTENEKYAWILTF